MMGRAGDIPLQFDAGWPSLHRNCLSIYAGETLQLRHTSWLRLHLKVCRHTHCLNEYFWDGEGFLLGRLFLLPIRCLLHRIARHLPLESLYSLSEQNPSQALQRAFSLPLFPQRASCCAHRYLLWLYSQWAAKACNRTLEQVSSCSKVQRGHNLFFRALSWKLRLAFAAIPLLQPSHQIPCLAREAP